MRNCSKRANQLCDSIVSPVMGDVPEAGDGRSDGDLLNTSELKVAEEKEGTSMDGSAQVSPQSTSLPCEMCQNYEINLTIMQDNERRLKEEIKAAKALSDRYESDLAAERSYRAELDRKFAEIAAQLEDKVKETVKQNSALEGKLSEVDVRQQSTIKKAEENREEAENKFKTLENEMTLLSEKYMRLLGTVRATASEMRDQPIDLPQDVDQLQFRCLQMREELIELKAASQHTLEENTGEITSLREQLNEEHTVRETLERDLLGQLNHVQTQLGLANSKLQSAGTSERMSEEQMRQIRDLQSTVAELEAQVTQVQSERKAVELTAQNYKARCSTLQEELDTSEAVQQDFVRLSQSLQIQLEKIRQSEQEVRWQWEEDVEKCSGCSTSVLKLKPKPRCLHCGRIFCAPCVKNTVPSGPNRRPATVCQVCHTLLNRDSKPFFAQEDDKQQRK